MKRFLSVLFFSIPVFSAWPGIAFADDCGARGYDGTAIVKLDCEPAGTTPSSRLKVRTAAGIRGLRLVDPETATGVPNPNASKFRVRYTDTSGKAVIKAIGMISLSSNIASCEELQMIGNHPAYPANGKYKMGADIDCSATNPSNPRHAASLWGKGYYAFYKGRGFDGVAGNADDKIDALSLASLGTKGFRSICWRGVGDWVFSGTFDGGSHKILNLYIATDWHIGLFGFVSGGVIQNVGLVGVSITGSAYIGGLAAHVTGSLITNSYVTGSVSGNKGFIGGLAGEVKDSSITNCYSTASVTGLADAYNVGGLVGSLAGGAAGSSSITNSYATGNVSGDRGIGGLAGSLTNASVTNSYATGNVTARWGAGGLVAFLHQSSVTGCYAKGAVTISKIQYWCGGLAAQVEYSSIQNSYATGAVGQYASMVGGLAGEVRNHSSVQNSYATGKVAGGSHNGGLVGALSANSFISNSYATGNMPAVVISSMGGLVGSNGSCPVLNSFFTDNTHGDQTGKGTYQPGGASAFYVASHAVYQDSDPSSTVSNAWDFAGTWKPPLSALPKLKWE